jgi:hypothetical protein
MSLNKKNLFIFSILALAFLFSANFALAQTQRSLEVPLLIEVEGVTLTETPILPDYVDYIFNLSVILAALIAFLSIIYGGVRHLTSAGNPAAMQDANDQIFAGVIGLIVILGSWILLTTINPQLIVINPQRGGTPEAIEGTGIFLCQTQELSPDTCEGPIFSNRSAVSDEFNDATSYVIFRNPGGTAYGVVLHKDDYFRGGCETLISSGATTTQVMAMGPLAGEVSSVTVFRDGSPSGRGVTLYECKDYECDQDVYSCDGGDCGGWGNQGRVWGPYYTTINAGVFKDNPNYTPHPKGAGIRSIQIEGSYLAILGQGENFSNRCEVFTSSDPDLNGNHIDACGTVPKIPCFDSFRVIPIE